MQRPVQASHVISDPREQKESQGVRQASLTPLVSFLQVLPTKRHQWGDEAGWRGFEGSLTPDPRGHRPGRWPPEGRGGGDSHPLPHCVAVTLGSPVQRSCHLHRPSLPVNPTFQELPQVVAKPSADPSAELLKQHCASGCISAGPVLFSQPEELVLEGAVHAVRVSSKGSLAKSTWLSPIRRVWCLAKLIFRHFTRCLTCLVILLEKGNPGRKST